MKKLKHFVYFIKWWATDWWENSDDKFFFICMISIVLLFGGAILIKTPFSIVGKYIFTLGILLLGLLILYVLGLMFVTIFIIIPMQKYKQFKQEQKNMLYRLGK